MLRGLFSVCAALGAAIVSSVPAFAGHYDQVTTYNGTTTVTTAYSSESHDWQTDGLSGQVGAHEWSHGSCNLSGTVTVTFTWVPDPALASDPAPQDVYGAEYADAYWSAEGTAMETVSGSRSVSIGGYTYPFQDYSDAHYKSSMIAKSDTHRIGGGGKFKTECTLQSTCSGGGPPTPGENLTRSTTLYVGASYSVNIIATPYGFEGVRMPWPDFVHDLGFSYTWKSTTGKKSDLASVRIYEHVTYQIKDATGKLILTDNEFVPPVPFHGVTIAHNPIDIHIYPQDDKSLWGWGNREELLDVHITCLGNRGSAPSYEGEFEASQEYRWYLPAIHDVATDTGIDTTGYSVMDGDKGPMHSILRKVEAVVGQPYKYTYSISKHNVTLTWTFDQVRYFP